MTGQRPVGEASRPRLIQHPHHPAGGPEGERTQPQPHLDIGPELDALMVSPDHEPGPAVQVPSKQVIASPMEVNGSLPDGCHATDVVVARWKLPARLTNFGIGHVYGHD